MSVARLAWLLVLPSALLPTMQAAGTQAADAKPARAFLEVAAPRAEFFVHEPFRVRLRLGVDAEFLRTNGLQMFQRQLDLPVRLEATWLAPFVAEPPPTASLTLALNDAVVPARRVADEARGGRSFTVVEIEQAFVPQEAGELVIPEATLRYAYATRFEDDLLRGRVAVDRHDGSVRSPPLRLRIDPLPAAGRPSGFSGAVGRFQLTAEWKDAKHKALPIEVRLGERFELVLRIEGDGSLEFLEPPRLGEADGFHLLGMLETKSLGSRAFTLELAALRADLHEVPPLAIDYFDPGPPAGYRTARSAPIALRVLATAEAPAPPAASDAADRRSLVRIVVLAAVILLGLLFRNWLRRRRLRGASPEDGPAPAERFRSEVAAAGAGVAFADYLATRLRCTTAAVIAPELPSRLVAAGVPPPLANRAATRLEALVAVRYRGPVPADDASADVAELTALVGELDVVFRARR